MPKQISASTPSQSKLEIKRPATVAHIFEELWGRTSDRLSDKELEWFEGATATANFAAQNLRDVVEGIGCLVSADEDRDTGRPNAGNFRSADDVSKLLFFIAQSVDSLHGLMTIGEEASFRRNHPHLFRPR